MVETQCRYASSLAFPDRVTVGVRVARIGNSSVRYEIALFRNDDDLASGEGYFVHVYVDRASRRPTSLPQDLRLVLEGLRSTG